MRVGAPAFDGGDPTTYFRIEWDLGADFEAAGGALGAAVGPRALTCATAASRRSTPTRTFYYDDDDNDARELMPGSRVYVVFSDDDVGYTFTVATSTRAHRRRAGLDRVASANFTAKPDLRLEGAQYTIAGLTRARATTCASRPRTARGSATSRRRARGAGARGAGRAAGRDGGRRGCARGRRGLVAAGEPGRARDGLRGRGRDGRAFPVAARLAAGRQEVQVVEAFYGRRAATTTSTTRAGGSRRRAATCSAGCARSTGCTRTRSTARRRC